jgi:hypothetical protein
VLVLVGLKIVEKSTSGKMDRPLAFVPFGTEGPNGRVFCRSGMIAQQVGRIGPTDQFAATRKAPQRSRCGAFLRAEAVR